MPQSHDTSQAAHSYTRLQIVLHWLVVILIAEQWVTSKAVARTHDPFLPPSETDLLLHMLHNYAGMLIGGLMVLRLGLWFVNPRQDKTGQRHWQTRAASTVHVALYLSVLGQASTGFVASYLWKGAIPFHLMFWNLTLTLACLHVLAAAYHLARGDEVVARMVPWLPRRRN
jgi:cytochrome b561